jgi:hypothetical protein
MKVYFACSVVIVLGFVAMGMQLGLFGNHKKSSGDAVAAAPEKKLAPAKAKFPEELAPAAQAQPVPIAAAFHASDLPHKMVFLKANGGLHPWHEKHDGFNEEWYTARVEETELVVVVGNSQKLAISHQTYPGGAPPITRYQYNLEAWLIEAKTGRVLANRWFHNMPRQLRARETWETTVIGAPVSYHIVFKWAADIAKNGPPSDPITTPIITTVDDER